MFIQIRVSGRRPAPTNTLPLSSPVHLLSMGGTSSKPEPTFDEKRIAQQYMVVKAKELADSLATLDLNGVATSTDGSLKHSNMNEWERKASAVLIPLNPFTLNTLNVNLTLSPLEPRSDALEDNFIAHGYFCSTHPKGSWNC